METGVDQEQGQCLDVCLVLPLRPDAAEQCRDFAGEVRIMNLRKMNGQYEAEIIVKTWLEGEWFCAQVRGREVMRSRHSLDRAISYALAALTLELGAQ